MGFSQVAVVYSGIALVTDIKLDRGTPLILKWDD